MDEQDSPDEDMILSAARTSREAHAHARRQQLAAWEQFQKDHPIAARKAHQQAQAEERRNTRVNLSFGKITMAGRE